MNVLNTTEWYNLFVLIYLFIYLAMPGLPWWLSGKESACNAGDLGLIPGLEGMVEDPLEEGMSVHSSILAWRIPMDRGARWATVHGV